MFGSLFGIVNDVVKIAVAPVEIAAGVARAVTKPIADVAQELAKDAKDLIKE